MQNKILLTVAEAAYLLNCSSGHVLKLIHSVKLKYAKKKREYLLHSDDIYAHARLTVNKKYPLRIK